MKRMGYRITPRMLEYFSKKGTVKIVESPIPEDAKWISSFHQPETGDFIVIFEHESFEDLPEGLYIPVFDSNSLMLKRKPTKKKKSNK